MKKIGFIGLGIMGEPMATNLLNAGYDLRVYDIRDEPISLMSKRGATGCNSIAQTVKDVDIVITMLPDSPDVHKVYLEVNGILKYVNSGTILVDMSTIAPSVAIEVADNAAQLGCYMLDAPVSGGDIGARNGTLSIMVGGENAVFQEVQPVLSVLGKSILCGGPGSGQIVKACNQILVAVTLLGMSEALVLGTKAGVDPCIIVNVLKGGLARCGVLENRGLRVIERDFTPGFKSKLHYKDLNIINETIKSLQISLPAAALAHELFGEMIARGRGELDHSGVITVFEDLAQVVVERKS
jgi:2-hydroxy-3-oxopropionate reductase